MKKSNFSIEFLMIILISIGFTVYGGLFIYKSSFITIDGDRSFSLFDDAMISMRYAWNFSHGNGLVWNPGERVQGYTNLLMVLLMSFATFAFSKTIAVLFMQIVGIIFMLVIAYLNMQIACLLFEFEDRGMLPLVRILSFLCSLAYYPLAYWTLMGMETGLLTMLLLSSILTALHFGRSGDRKILVINAILLGLAFLTRNDSIIFAILIWAYIIWKAIDRDHDYRILRQLAAPICLYFLIIVGQFTFQYLYYGDILPNTYTLKLTGMPFLLRIRGGAGFIIPFLNETAFLLILSIISLAINFRREKSLLFLIIMLAICYQVFVGGDPWNYWRMMAPAIPLAAILSIDTLIFLIHKLLHAPFIQSFLPRNLTNQGRLIASCFVGLSMLAGTLSANLRFLPEAFLQVKPYQSTRNARNVDTAIALNELLRKDATIGVFWGGSISYYANFSAIDFLGKSDKYIARLPADISGSVSWFGMQSVPGHNKYDLNYSIVVLRPTYVQRFFWGGQDVSSWAETKYVEAEYRGLTLFLLKDSPAVLWTKVKVP